MFEGFDYYKGSINLGPNYKIGPREYAVVDSKNKKMKVKTIPEPDDTIVKEFHITLKNYQGGVVKRDTHTSKSYVDFEKRYGYLKFTGTEKELSQYCEELNNEKIWIQDIYENE
jgi:hypothetical protein